jgi:hypothetical protein
MSQTKTKRDSEVGLEVIPEGVTATVWVLLDGKILRDMAQVSTSTLLWVFIEH